MSCDACERVQDRFFKGYDDGLFYMRIGRANVLIVACEEHTREVQALIRYALRSDVRDGSYDDSQTGKGLLEEALQEAAPTPGDTPEVDV